MTENEKFKVGDMIVKYGEVCKIVKIEKRKNDNGDKDDILHYKPIFSEYKAREVMYSIPARNISLTTIRKLISKKEMRKLIKNLSKSVEIDEEITIVEYTERFKSNDPHEIADVLKEIWVEKQEEETDVGKAKDDLYKASVKILVEEVAFLKNTTVAEAEKLIVKALGK